MEQGLHFVPQKANKKGSQLKVPCTIRSILLFIQLYPELADVHSIMLHRDRYLNQIMNRTSDCDISQQIGSYSQLDLLNVVTDVTKFTWITGYTVYKSKIRYNFFLDLGNRQWVWFKHRELGL